MLTKDIELLRGFPYLFLTHRRVQRSTKKEAQMSQRTVSIYVIGPSSTGKTTLCNALAQKLGITKDAYVTEVARQVMRETAFSRDTIGSLEMQTAIMEAHFRREEALDENNATGTHQFPIRLFDRSAIDPVVYAILTSKSEAEAIARKNLLINTNGFQSALAKYTSPNSVVVLLKPVKKWVQDDGVRSLENLEKCVSIFEGLLGELGIQYRQFGDEEQRLEGRVVRSMGFAGL